MAARCLALIVWFSPVSVLSSQLPVHQPQDIDAQIRFYEDKLSTHPRLHGVAALLGAAYLAKARQSYDPRWLARSQAILERSLDIQPNFAAFRTMAALHNYRHRFDQAIVWAQRAAAAQPKDAAVTALLIEAHLGRGETETAAKLVPQPTSNPGDYYTAVAVGQWFIANDHYDKARAAFLSAADFARKNKVAKLEVWAYVSAAGTLLDTGRAAQARPYLEKAERLDPRDHRLGIHWAEFYAGIGDAPKALQRYESLLQVRKDPQIHHSAFLLATRLGEHKRAARHFNAAEAAFRRVIEADEIYTLEAIAQLYCDANVNLQAAHKYAQQNLKYKRDPQAHQTLACVRGKLDSASKAKGSKRAKGDGVNLSHFNGHSKKGYDNPRGDVTWQENPINATPRNLS